MRLVLPYPISANRYWRTAVLRGANHATTYVSKEASSYKRDVRIAAFDQGCRRPISGRVAVALQLYPHRPRDWQRRVRQDPLAWDDSVQCLDLDNAFKVLHDALRGVAFDDDCWVRRIVAERMEPDGEARVVVAIEPIVREHPQGVLISMAMPAAISMVMPAANTGESCELPAGMARVPQRSAAQDDRIATQPVAHQSREKGDGCSPG